FYEECTASIWERDEDFQIQRSPSRWSSLLWKVCLAFGTLILFAGLIVLLVGYATPTRFETFGEDDLLFVDSHAVSFNRALDVCKLTGAVLFCVGGTSMAVGLLLSAFAKSYSKEELYLQQKFKERLADLQATVGKLDWFCYRYPHNESAYPWRGKGASHTFQSPEHPANDRKVRDLTEVQMKA
ncbi:Neurensin-1, partial [Nibea albiflora]